MNIKDSLATVLVTKKDRERFMPYMSNWVLMSKFIKDIKWHKDVLMMIKIELLTKNRPEIVFRLHSKYNSLRRKVERAELMEMLHEGEKG